MINSLTAPLAFDMLLESSVPASVTTQESRENDYRD